MTSRQNIAPRVAPLSSTELDDEAVKLLAQVGERGAASNVFRTLARHQSLLRRFIPYGGRLVNGALAVRTRELVILRVAVRSHCSYEWAGHVDSALDAGITIGEIRSLRAGLDGHPWSAPDRAVLRAVDELHETSSLADETWEALASHLEEPQLLELPLLVGHFLAVAYFLNSLAVENDGPGDALHRLDG